jgi:hypothetical protein
MKVGEGVEGPGSTSKVVDFECEPGKVGQVASKPEHESVEAEKQLIRAESRI